MYTALLKLIVFDDFYLKIKKYIVKISGICYDLNLLVCNRR